MNGNMRKRIMAILLSGAICVSNCIVPSYASGVTFDPVVESEAGSEKGSSSAGIVEENPGEVENTGSEQGQEGNESGDEAEQGGEETTVDPEEEASDNVENNIADTTIDNVENNIVDTTIDNTEDNTEDATAENTADSTEDNLEEATEESEQEALMALSAETGTFADLAELKSFYEANDTGTLKNALDFTNYNNNIIGANANGLILLSCVENGSFEGYTIKLSGLSGGGSNLSSQIDGFPAYHFKGLGRSGSPFKGTITVSDATTVEYIDLTLDQPLFNAIDVASAKINKITKINIITARESAVAFAQEVSGSNADLAWSNVEVDIKAYTYTDNEATTTTYPGSCIGTIKSNTKFSLKKISYISDAKINEVSGNAGLLCNEIESNATFQVGSVAVSDSVSIIAGSGKAAGGLVGDIAENASLSVGSTEKLTINENWGIKGKNAGALIGKGKNAALNLNVEVNGAKVTSSEASGSAGGIFGSYQLTSEAPNTAFQTYDVMSGTIQVTNVVLDATADNSCCGALFGVLELSKDFSVNGSAGDAVTVTSTAGLAMSGSSYVLKGSTSYGGLAGQVYGTDSSSSLPALKISGNISVSSTTNGDVTYYGGLIGVIGKPGIDAANKNGAYVVIKNQTSTTCTNSEKLVSGGHYFGGAVGGMFYDSVLEIAEDATFSPTASNIKYGGGIVGVTGRKSTLRLAGTTNLEEVTFAAHAVGQNPGSDANYRNANGQIVGVQNASIIYAAKSWTLKRPTILGEIDDIGNYGSVIRLGKNIGQGSGDLADKGGLSDTLIQQDANTHKTSFGIAAATLNSGTIEIENADQFALLSIADQTYGDFGIYSSVTNGFIIGGNKVNKIVLKANIDLSNTGISGLQRDFYNGSNVYTGELDGGRNTLKLDIGQLYANNDATGAGNGQIHGHPQVGLFSQANVTIKNLTIDGNINVRERALNKPAANQTTSMAVGGCVALSTGSGSTFENVTTNVTIKCEGDGTESIIGGLLGLKQGTGSSVSISNCIGNATILDMTDAGIHAIGGLIGVHAGGYTITVSDTTLTGKISGASDSNIKDAKFGGLISVIKDNAASMNLNNLTVAGQIIENNATTTSGGLLGYEWNNSEVYFGDGSSSNVTIQGESGVKVTGNASAGALVCRATGYWQVNSLKLNKADIQNQSGDLGLLICYGRKEYVPNSDAGSQLLYVEETKHDGYHIDGANVSVSSSGSYFDEWVVYTAEDAESITENGNSVISIATEEEGGGRKGFDPTDSTSTGYQNKTTNNGTAWSAANPNARYYYDLDDIREKAKTTNGYVDTPGEAVLWSVWRYCEKVSNGKGGIVTSNIQEYLKTADIASETFDGNGATIDLTGYSYYPVNVDGASVEIKKCTFVFANQVINSAEEKTGTGLDTLDRKTSGTAEVHTQHYLMHSGLVLDYKNTSTSKDLVTFTVKDVTFQGAVGKGIDNNGSGAIICGTVFGSSEGGNHIAKIEINNVVLNDIKVNSNISNMDYAPLLINKVGSYGSVDAQQISTAGYNSNEKAATSLIGHVGSNTATNIALSFSNNIKLSGKTTDSIFSRATLLESFQYRGASSGYYHFNEGEECTYGREISGTIEYDGLQLKYFDTDSDIADNGNKDFMSESYLPYVFQTKVIDSTKGDTFHELEINVKKPDLIKGCGTYDDPYIIEQGVQLQMVALSIAGTTTAGWKVNVVTDPESVETNESDNHKTYTYGNDGKWSYNSEQLTIDMRDYLRNAYYKLSQDLELHNYSGLGNADKPFLGVVDGSNYTVTIDASKISSGFINVSYGTVVQNINITYTGVNQVLSNNNSLAALNSNMVANESYFGGIIGDVKGGDNIIRNVTVTYQSNFKISVSNHLQCVGGFLGIVEGGGVVFSDVVTPQGMKVSGNDKQIETSLAEKELAYVSSLVGRVLDGFVINETGVASSGTPTVLVATGGTDKNYSIANISINTSVNMDSAGNVEISSPEQLLILSAIINSGACSAGYSLAYKSNAKVRNADYSQIGKRNTDFFNKARMDDAHNPSEANLPYLVQKYASKNSDFWTLCCESVSSSNADKYLNLTINADLDMSAYGNGYRGIGGRYNCTATSSKEKTEPTLADQKNDSQFQRNTPVFEGVNGNENTLTVSNVLKGYSDDNFVATAAGGIINMLRRKKEAVITIQNLTVSGSVELHDFSDNPDSKVATNSSDRRYTASVGGVIGRYFTEESTNDDTQENRLCLKNLKVETMRLYSDGAVGGIVGQTGIKYLFPFGDATNQYYSGVTYTNCSYNSLTATSCNATGGIVGAACDNANSYRYGETNATKITNKIEVNTGDLTGGASTLNVYASTVSENGLGGLAGSVGSNFEINKGGNHPLILESLTLQENATSISRTGGAIGFLHHGTTTAYNIKISNSQFGNGKDDNLGGIVGCWYSPATGGVMENITIDSCKLSADLSVGGVVGYIDKGTKIIRNITVNTTSVTQQSSISDRGAAMVVGQIAGGGIFGENILLKNNAITAKTSSRGRIIGAVGNSGNLPIQLLGVSVQYGNDKNGMQIDVASQPTEDIGSIPYNQYSGKNSKIFISYDAFLTAKTVGSELAQWPYVEIPGVGFEETTGTDTTYKITGDTVNPYTITGSDSVTGIVKKEGTAYSYIGSKKTYQYVNPANVDRLVPGIVSTYNANQDTKIGKDFNVIQIDGSAACLKQYLNAATNGAFATGVAISKESAESNKVMTVDVSRYKWDSSQKKFVKDTDAKPTLVYDSTDGSFYATAQYDNQSDMFTLISVTFKTNSTTSDNDNFTRTYHIPVIVRRMLQVDFMATMVSGTVFNAAEMEGYKTHALASKGEEITGYLTFKYNSNLSGLPATYDWQSYMEGGANLLGYYQKTMDTGSENLPAGTHITLIDCQQSERRYYAVVPEGGSQLEIFSGNNLDFKHSDDTPYQPVSLAELLKIEATQITDSAFDGIKWVALTKENKAEATVVDKNGNYYRLYDDKKDSALNVTDCFTLKITNTSPEENYFVVISVPNAENHMLTLIKSGGVTKGSFVWSDTEASAPPTEIHQLHRYKDENTGKYTPVSTNASSEITFNFLDNYAQDLKDLLPVETIPVTSAGSTTVEMSFELQNKVTFVPDNYEKSDPLYQELRVSLRKTTDGVGSDVYFPSDTTATVDLYAYYIKDGQRVYFAVDENGKLKETSTTDQKNPPVVVSYDWLAGNDGNMVLPFAVKKDNGTYQYIDLSPLRIASESQKTFYLEAKLKNPISIGINSIITNDMLPVRETPESQNQTNMYFTSVLSFKESGLSYSTLRKSVSGNKGYYLNEKREAVLKLDYLDVDQLGINLNDEYSGEINTTLTLDLSGSEGFNSNLSKFEILNEADTVVFDFSLKQKGKDGLTSVEYGDVAIGDYLDGAQITNGRSIESFRLEVKKADGKYPYYNEATGVFSIPVTFKVKTNDVLQYSNYRIYASADILKDSTSQKVAISAEKAFLTYTVAKININGIWQKPGS